MPLTGVGKAFEPELRWDAATRALTKTLVPLTEKGIDCSVQGGPHGSHGSMATVTIVHIPVQKREAVAAEVHTMLAPFVLYHEIVFN